MSAYVVLREFRVKSGALDDFLEAAAEDARKSLAEDLGCRQFEVNRPEGSDDTVIFYQVYDDEAAFEAHLATPHLVRFREAREPLAEEARATVFARRVWP